MQLFMVGGYHQDPLVWWKLWADKHTTCVENIWWGWRVEEISRYINRRPLTQEDFNYFLHERVRNLNFENQQATYMFPVSSQPILFDILVGIPREERAISLTHEIVHGFYCYQGDPFGPRPSPREQVVEREARRFYHENRSFLKKVLERRGIDTRSTQLELF